MTGEEHSDRPHDVLLPLANIQFVDIGDVQDYNNRNSADFQIVKYLKVDGEKNPTTKSLT